jgi:TonB family protein
MIDSVSTLLEQRANSGLAGAFRKALVAALALHLLAPVAIWLVPRWLAPPPPPREYVSIQIVPAAKLGVEKPPPQPKAPELLPVPKPKPAAPVLPKPAKKPAPKPAKPKPEPQPETPPQTAGSPNGKVGGLALGAPSATLDNPDFTYGYYVDQMLAQISRNWTRPPVGSGIQAVLHYRILRDGSIVDAEIVESSGVASFDLAALRAVESSSPLPPLPRGFREDSLGVNLIVR